MDAPTQKPETTPVAGHAMTQNQTGWPETLNALTRHANKLEVLLLISLGAIIILSIGMNVVLTNQVKVLQARYNEQNPAVKQYAKGFRENDEPLYRSFALTMQQYAATNRDFLPIWDKYRPVMTNLLTAAKPVPATPVQPPKAGKK